MIKVCHEVPKDLFTTARSFNDYDYYLDYLYEDKEYCDFFKESLKQGRTAIMDSSLFEFHPIVPPIDRFFSHVVEFGHFGKNIEYIVTDVLDNKDATIEKFEEWNRLYRKDAPGIAIGVVQGSTLSDLVECYKYMTKHADKIAIPFDSKGFDDLIEEEETDQLARWAKGRQRFVQYLITEGLWKQMPVHLLGCSYVWEFECPLYTRIESIDTSSPIIYGIKGMKYGKDGNDQKPSIKLCELIDYKPTEEEKKLINYNVKKFRSIVTEK